MFLLKDGRRVSVTTRILNAVGAEHVRVPSFCMKFVDVCGWL